MDSQQELSPPSTISTQQTTMNLQDLQSYLVTFNKEIEPSDQNSFQVFCSSKYLRFSSFLTILIAHMPGKLENQYHYKTGNSPPQNGKRNSWLNFKWIYILTQ